MKPSDDTMIGNHAIEQGISYIVYVNEKHGVSRIFILPYQLHLGKIFYTKKFRNLMLIFAPIDS